MPKIDFVAGTATPGSHRFDFVAMTPEQLADKLAEGVPADNLKKLAEELGADADAQAKINKVVAAAIRTAVKVASSGGNPLDLAAALVK